MKKMDCPIFVLYDCPIFVFYVYFICPLFGAGWSCFFFFLFLFFSLLLLLLCVPLLPLLLRHPLFSIKSKPIFLQKHFQRIALILKVSCFVPIPEVIGSRPQKSNDLYPTLNFLSLEQPCGAGVEPIFRNCLIHLERSWGPGVEPIFRYCTLKIGASLRRWS